MWRVGFVLAQAALFSENDASAEEICIGAEMSEPTVAKNRKRTKELGFLTEVHKGRQRYYSLDLRKMAEA